MNSEMTTRDKVIHKIAAASELLIEAHSVALESNPLATSVPEITALQAKAKELNALMQSISRMRL